MKASEIAAALLNPANAYTAAEVKEISSALRARSEWVTSATVRSFRTGDKVEFDHAGKHYTGVVTKINQKTVSVKGRADGAPFDQNWKVSGSLLRKAA